MMVESLTIAQAQLADKLTKEECNYVTLQTDGTTKYRQQQLMIQFTTWVYGTHFSGSAQSMLDS